MIISETTAKLFSSMIKARTEIESVIKDKNGYGYKYATLDNVINMLKGVLPKYGLGFAQFPESINGKDGVTTIVMHESGEYMSARYEMEATEMKGTNLTQQKGASITYTRRYSLCSVFGIPTEEDTDGVIEEEKSSVKEEKSSVEDIIKGIEEKMTLDNWKVHYAKAIKLYPKGTEEFKLWSKIFNDKKKDLEKNQKKDELQEESEFLDSMAGDITQDYYD